MPGHGKMYKHKLVCSEIWGGIKNEDIDAVSAALHASLFSSSCKGGKGGDIYYLSVCAHEVVTRIAIADVTGHGESVSNVSQWLFDSLQEHMSNAQENIVLEDVNRVAAEAGLSAMTTAVVVGVYRNEYMAYFVYAGHPPAMICKRNLKRWRRIIGPRNAAEANLPLGVEADTRYSLQRVSLQKGDRLFLYSDGVIETPGRNGTQFGEDGLRKVLQNSVGKSLSAMKSSVLSALREYAGGSLRHDDVTLMAIEIL